MKETRSVIYLLIAVILGAAIVSAFVHHNWASLFVVSLTLLLSIVPFALNKRYGIEISKGMRLGIVIFLFSTLFLGEARHYYDTYEWWDLVLHFWAGFGMTIFGFVILSDVYKHSELRSVPFLTTLYAFSFSAMLMGLWEIYEYLVDLSNISADPMQLGLSDTMGDLLAGYAAALLVGVFGYRYLKWRKKNFAGKAMESTHVAQNGQKHTNSAADPK